MFKCSGLDANENLILDSLLRENLAALELLNVALIVQVENMY